MGCKTYKQHIMFKIDKDEDLSFLSSAITIAEKNYKIQPNDLLEVRVYTNKGERIIDPNYELQQGQGQRSQQNRDQPEFLVLDSGDVKLPMIGMVHLEGMTIEKAEKYLEDLYESYYIDPFVRVKYMNKRVIVLGSPGGLVLPLENESISLIEVIAMAGGIDESGKAHNIRLIRGDLHEPEIFLIDLSTVSGMRHAMLDVRPGDIVYVEPTRKIVTEALRDLAVVMASITSLLTLIVLINN
jgi:polysaccharide export outer membrane protein